MKKKTNRSTANIGVEGLTAQPPGFHTAAPLVLLPAALRAGSVMAAWEGQGARVSGGSGCIHSHCAVPLFKA